MTNEGDIYAILHTHNVPNIVPFGIGNDVRDHVTRTQDFEDATWARRPSPEGEEMKLTRLRQYRMTLLVIVRPLIEFESSKEFVTAISHAIKSEHSFLTKSLCSHFTPLAHDHAYFDAKILHRDISVGNFLITEDEQGI